MKKFTLLLITLTISFFALGSELVLIPTGSMDKIKQVFNQSSLTIHYYSDRFAIGTRSSDLAIEFISLDENPWDSGNYYYILYYNPSEREGYVDAVSQASKIIHRDETFLVVSVEPSKASRLYPSVRGGMVRISQNPARLPGDHFQYRTGLLSSRNDIWSMIGQVDTSELRQSVQYLQDLGTRNAYKPGSIQAQNWIYDKFASYGLSVELHDFSMPGGPASDNVIATLTGTQYPDEYVVLGAHYDSYAGGSYEPGADDNATGTAGILEIARILSQYQFDRSIIFATWSGEEYGLYGSEAWASEAAQNGMNILGYFNIDMAGYLEPGSDIHTDVIAPSSAAELKQFYTDVCAIYLPEFQVSGGFLSGGDSDHTSFNNAGFQGIFPFEDSQNYSPYIHSTNDVIGLSVNSFEQHGIFVQATLASVATLADMLPTPENLTAIAGDGEITLEWTGIDSVDHYNIYRNGNSTVFATTNETEYIDGEVTNGETYTYFVTAVFLNTGEESGPSNTVTVVPMPPITFPFYDDYETGAPYWTFESPWGLQTGIYHSPSYSMTESPGGNYSANLDISAALRSIDLTGAASAQISFWTRYQLETGYDYMYLEVSKDGIVWDRLASFTGNQNTWAYMTYPLDNYLNEVSAIIRFHFTSDGYIEANGMFIDDFEIDVTGVGLGEHQAKSGNVLRIMPNPAVDQATVTLNVVKSSAVRMELTDAAGRTLKNLVNSRMDAGIHTFDVDLASFQDGLYFIILDSGGMRSTHKLIISR